jgi:hypothetical protein
MKNIPLLLLFLASSIYSQDSSYIKTLDTIFVNFKEDKFQIKTVFPIDKIGFQKRWYTFILGNNHDRKFIRFYIQEYTNPEKRDKKIKSDVRIEKKSFFKKYKKQIIGIDFFKNHDVCTLRDVFHNKVVYVIDVTERKREKPTLYEATSSFSCDAIE